MNSDENKTFGAVFRTPVDNSKVMSPGKRQPEGVSSRVQCMHEDIEAQARPEMHVATILPITTCTLRIALRIAVHA